MLDEKEAEKEIKPFDRKEIRGLTIESIVKYISIIGLILGAAWKLSGKTEDNTHRIEVIEQKYLILEAENKVLKEQHTNDEIWKAHAEDKLNRIK